MWYFGLNRTLSFLIYFFFFNDPATTEIYTLSLHDALPIWSPPEAESPNRRPWSHSVSRGVMRGSRLVSWKRRPMRARRACEGVRPRTRTVPEEGRRRPARRERRVDLPEPLGPRRPKTEPEGMSRERPSRACPESACPEPCRWVEGVRRCSPPGG